MIKSKTVIPTILITIFLLSALFVPRDSQAQAEATPTATFTPVPEVIMVAVTAVQPTSVSNTVATELVITGADFADGAVVILTGYGALETTFVSSSVLRAVLPADTPPGVYTLTVVNPDASSAALANALTVTAPTAPTRTPAPTNTPAPTAFVRPLLVVQSYGASSTEITPGQDLDFEMTLVNSGQSRASNVIATFVAGNFVARATGGVRALGTLDPNQTNRFWQPLSASRDLSGQSIGTLEVRVDYTDVNGTAYSETFALTFPIVRQSSGPAATATPTPTATATATAAPRVRPQLLITHYETNVAQLEPGKEFVLQLSLQNQGNADARRVTMILGGGSSTGGSGLSGTPESGGGLSGASGEFSNFAPVNASNVQFLGDVQQGESLTAVQPLIVNASTKAGAYPVKVSFVYNDAAGSSFVDDQVITLLVYQRPALDINFYMPPAPFFVGQPGQLPLQVVNSGRNTAVLGTLSVTAGSAMLENASIFVGTLEPGGFFPLDATLYPDLAGSLDLLISVSYTDDFNQPQVVTQTLTVDVMDAPVFEPGMEEGGLEPPPVAEPQPETTWQKIKRFLLGLIGLSSGVPETAVNSDFGGPVPGEGEFVPQEGVPVQEQAVPVQVVPIK
ncbi:MAG: IPT/TIG domain-containing protein [Ardenticatenaceae bacterium]|nr:IPT/TIG domain-containing protein [Ardenticatenaceae bacterium]